MGWKSKEAERMLKIFSSGLLTDWQTERWRDEKKCSKA
jgi:hypothetical protein